MVHDTRHPPSDVGSLWRWYDLRQKWYTRHHDHNQQPQYCRHPPRKRLKIVLGKRHLAITTPTGSDNGFSGLIRPPIGVLGRYGSLAHADQPIWTNVVQSSSSRVRSFFRQHFNNQNLRCRSLARKVDCLRIFCLEQSYIN